MENVYQNVVKMKYTFSGDVNVKKVFNRLMENVSKVVKKMKSIRMENVFAKMVMLRSLVSVRDVLKIQLLLLIKVNVSVKVDFNGIMVNAQELNVLKTQNLSIKITIISVNVFQVM